MCTLKHQEILRKYIKPNPRMIVYKVTGYLRDIGQYSDNCVYPINGDAFPWGYVTWDSEIAAQNPVTCEQSGFQCFTDLEDAKKFALLTGWTQIVPLEINTKHIVKITKGMRFLGLLKGYAFEVSKMRLLKKLFKQKITLAKKG